MLCDEELSSDWFPPGSFVVISIANPYRVKRREGVDGDRAIAFLSLFLDYKSRLRDLQRDASDVSSTLDTCRSRPCPDCRAIPFPIGLLCACRSGVTLSVAAAEAAANRRPARDFSRGRTTCLSPALSCGDGNDERRGR